VKARLSIAIGLIALAAAVTPAPAGATAKPAQGQKAKTLTLRWYSVVVGFVYTRADGTVLPQPPQNAAAGDQFAITELAYKGTHESHAKKWSASAHTICVFKSANAAPTCEGVAAVGGNQLLLFHTASGSDPVVAGGTGRYAGATGTVTMKEVGDTNNSDIAVAVQLRK
jgi:hypothetical protein